jgi:protein-tyrosine phosphatase
MSLTELPYGLPGRVFRSRMPYSAYDTSGELVDKYIEEGISTIVLLAREQEYLQISNRDLKKLYTEKGFRVLHLPTTDYGIPAQGALEPAVREIYELVRDGENVAIHCHAGIGRTGMFAACLARQVLGLTGEQAIDWVRERIPYAVETPEQRDVVHHFEPEEG